MATEQLAEGLRQFSGSERLFRHWTRSLVYTEGVQFMADQAESYWLLDVIASYQGKIARANKTPEDAELKDFQVWFLKPDKGRVMARVECWADTGEGRKPRIVQRIPFTDFPLAQFGKEGIKLYVERGENGMCLMLPGER